MLRALDDAISGRLQYAEDCHPGKSFVGSLLIPRRLYSNNVHLPHNKQMQSDFGKLRLPQPLI
jgi:hypothetical protein